MKKIFVSLSLILSIQILTNVSMATSWYCKRNGHNQPDLGSDLRFCENYDLYWCDKRHFDMAENEKVIYLTFDAGYENGNVEKIVDVLEKENVPAAFFVLDNMIIKNKNLIKRMIRNGHIIANHTMKHKDMTKITSKENFANELSQLEQLYKEYFGCDMKKYYRPPEGKFNEENLKWAKELGYKTIMWSFAYADWDNGRQPSYDIAMKKILSNLHNGEVMLLHPTSSTNAEIMEELIKTLKSQGFRFGTLDELCS